MSRPDVALPQAQASPTVRQTPSPRGLDWRFLLPNATGRPFGHLALLGAEAGLADLAREAGVAERVSVRWPVAEAADALVVLRGARASLAEVVDSLKPGGVAYVEIDRGRPPHRSHTPGRIRRVLTASGLQPLVTYWLRPDCAAPQTYLPLEAEGALRWYVRSLYTARTPLARVGMAALPWLAKAGGPRYEGVVRCFALTAVRPPATVAPSALASADFEGQLGGGPHYPLMLTPGSQDDNRVVLLPFGRRSAEPRAVLKLSRLVERNAGLRREQQVMAELRAHLDTPMRESIPQPLGIGQWGRLEVAMESCARGQLLAASSSQWGTPPSEAHVNLRLVADWLKRFHQQVQVQREPWGSPDIQRWVEAPLARYRRAFGATPTEARLFAALLARAASLTGCAVPVVWQHYGLWDWNIYRDGAHLAIIDWESAEPGLPLFDLLYFALHWAFTVDRLSSHGAKAAAFRRLFVSPRPTDPMVAAVHDVVADYMAALDLDRRFAPLLLALLWITHALGRSTREGNRYVDYVAILADQVGDGELPNWLV